MLQLQGIVLGGDIPKFCCTRVCIALLASVLVIQCIHLGLLIAFS